MRPLLEQHFAAQLNDWERYIKLEGCIHGDNDLDFECVEYCEESLRNYAVDTDRERRASLYGLTHLVVINSREDLAPDLRHKRQRLERHFSKHLDKMEESMRTDKRNHLDFLAFGSREAIDLVRYHVHRIRRFPGEDATWGCQRHQIRGAICFLMYDACVIKEGAK